MAKLNNILKLGYSLEELDKQEELNLINNKIKYVTKEIDTLINLKISALNNLQELYLCNNQIQFVPKEIRVLPNLQIF